jgi:hypothetical protein
LIRSNLTYLLRNGEGKSSGRVRTKRLGAVLFVVTFQHHIFILLSKFLKMSHQDFTKWYFRSFILLTICSISPLFAQKNKLVLANETVKIEWTKTKAGWKINQLTSVKEGKWMNEFTPSGEYTLLYSKEKPSEEPKEGFEKSTGGKFPEDNYTYQKQQWKESVTEVALNTGGTAFHFFPSAARQQGGTITFESETDVATIKAVWSFDPSHPSDVKIQLSLTPKSEGYFSLASPTLGTLSEKNMAWVSVPGYFQSNHLQSDFALAYTYGHGAPTRPVVYRERCASTLAPLLSSTNGFTLSVIPDPGVARDPWTSNKITQTDWHLGLSHMNRKAQLSPTLYHPVLGEPFSFRKKGDSISWGFRYSLIEGNWFEAIKHAAYDIYRFEDGLKLRKNTQSLTDRVHKMHRYLTDPETSHWNVEEFKGYQIGAQSYLGGVVGSQKDAMKNSDYGAMWMLARLTSDPELNEKVLPPASNFKLVQQDVSDAFFKGAVDGQYYLAKRKKFVEEWGEVSEPIALTYYVMLDMGNILLFEPENEELKSRLRLGAERLLEWQKTDGSWAVAYDRNNSKEIFQDIQDLRPTFYGLLVAHRILKDPKYLAAARKGADWLLENGIKKGAYLGVCGDARYAPDFATGQTAQAYLDLYETTLDKKYLDAAIAAAKVYTTSVYTHPIPSTSEKLVNGTKRFDWEIAQAGLSFEHGGIFGSATRHGPIQLASHAGMFLRMAQLTGEPIFKDFARATAIGRHAFVDDKTSVASYYWNAMNRGAGPYPHHAWWQIGWISDYLLTEASLRSDGRIKFPRGFVTPKVGPHQTYGFDKGEVYGKPAALIIREGLLQIDNPSIEYLLALDESSKTLYTVLMNNYHSPSNANVLIDLATLIEGTVSKLKNVQAVENAKLLAPTPSQTLQIPAYGIQTLAIQYE